MTDMLPAASLRTIDGSGNNSANPQWNTENSAEVRIAPPNFAPGTTNTPIDGPNPREISSVVSSGPNADNHDPNGGSAFMYVWGQVLDHDIDRTPQDNTNRIDINIPSNDSTFPNADPIPLTRFVTDPNSGTATNAVTGWIDGSMIYGSDSATADSLRLPDGHLRTSDGGNLPIDNGTFVAGDVRVSENPDLTAITTLFVREHNYQVDTLKQQHSDWTGDQLYQTAKSIVTAEIQNITFTEFLPRLLGDNAIAPYHGYDPTVDPRITQEFSTAAFRFGHSIVSGTESKLDNQGNAIATQSLSDAFLDTPDDVKANGGVDALIRNFGSDQTQANDPYAIDSLRNLLTAPPDFVDLIAIDIQRERDLGIGTLNQTREALGLTPYTDFTQITSDPAVQANLQQEFGSVDNVDLFIGGLAEDHVNGGMLGETFETIIAQQFQNLRDGDQFWWENQGFDEQTTQMIHNTTLSDIIMRDTNTSVMQPNAFQATDRHPASDAPEDPNAPQLIMGENQSDATITGGPNDDTIVNGLGRNQTLTGNGGHNVFVFDHSDQSATVTDFDPSMDKLEFPQLMAADFVSVTKADDGGAMIHYNGDAIHLTGVSPDQLSAHNYLYVPHPTA